MKKMLLLFTLVLCLSAMTAAGAAAEFHAFVIRPGSSGDLPVIQPNNDYTPGATEFVINESGMKAGWGSDALNTFTIGQIGRLAVTRYEDLSPYSPGSGPYVAPYFNIWITDGNGQYAVVANEPSNPAFQPLFTANPDGSHSYDLSFADLADKVAKIYETPGAGTSTSWVHTLLGKTTLTFADLASLTIAPPPASYIADTNNAVGSGAPDELGTHTAYGFTWVFGDTLSNYVSGETPGYVVGAPGAAPVPLPGAIWLLASGVIGFAGVRRKALR